MPVSTRMVCLPVRIRREFSPAATKLRSSATASFGPHHFGNDAEEGAAVEGIGSVGEDTKFEIAERDGVRCGENFLGSLRPVTARRPHDSRRDADATVLIGCHKEFVLNVLPRDVDRLYFNSRSKCSSMSWNNCVRAALPEIPCVLFG